MPPQEAHTAPNCVLSSLDGTQRYDIRQFFGKVLYVDFWASWCGPCAQSFPFLNELDRDLGSLGLQVLGINLDEKPADALKFLAVHPARFPIAADAAGACPRSFGVTAMPSSYLIDRRGVIRHVHAGFRRGQADQLRDIVQALLLEDGGA